MFLNCVPEWQSISPHTQNCSHRHTWHWFLNNKHTTEKVLKNKFFFLTFYLFSLRFIYPTLRRHGLEAFIKSSPHWLAVYSVKSWYKYTFLLTNLLIKRFMYLPLEPGINLLLRERLILYTLQTTWYQTADKVKILARCNPKWLISRTVQYTSVYLQLMPFQLRLQLL